MKKYLKQYIYIVIMTSLFVLLAAIISALTGIALTIVVSSFALGLALTAMSEVRATTKAILKTLKELKQIGEDMANEKNNN